MSEWINVDDRLPKDNQNVLLFVNDYDTFGKYVEKIYFGRRMHRKEYDGALTPRWVVVASSIGTKGFALSENGSEYSEPCKVTHWMPIPESPILSEQAKKDRVTGMDGTIAHKQLKKD